MAESQTLVATESGVLVGTIGHGGAVHAFKGIPYAAPPVGNLRWRAPAPAVPWSGTRAADCFGPRCAQPERPPTAIGYFGAEPQSEDCLYLNVWTGARAGDERRAVMVWFHGGAYAVGSGSLPIFDGEKLALKGVVVVTANYRLGRLGFFAHPDLAREAPYGASGNYGLLDQIAVLHWIRRNIAAFGGDPERVTIFGQSVGSSSVNMMMASPLARGLFHRAIGQSGGALARRAMPLREESERAGVAFAQALGALTVDKLRARPALEIQLVRPDHGGRVNDIYDSADADAVDRGTAWATIDGYVLADRVRDIFERGDQNDVPLLTGATRDEGATLPHARSLAEFETRARTELGSTASDFLAHYRAGDDAGAEQASRAAAGHRTFNWENWLWARLQARTGRAPVFTYHFARVPPRVPGGESGDRSRALGAFHTADIPYVFDHLEARDWPWQETDRLLAEQMSSYWTNFAKAGDPNGSGLPPWPRFHDKTQQVMRFGDEAVAGPAPDGDKLAFWSAVDDALRRSDRP
jgi:para-nitrobenzyl esterase